MAFQKPSNSWIISLIILHVMCCKPTLGNWSVWGMWSDGPCSVTCGNGNRTVTRSRFCNNPENNCAGQRQDKKYVPCQPGGQCGDLDCYECNIFRSGKIVPCTEMKIQNRCRACLKSYTRIRIHDRMGYAKDSVVESKMCVRHEDFNDKSSEECEYHRSNGGISIVCHCFSDRCNNGVRHGASLGLWVFMVLVWTQCKGLLIRA